MHRTHVNNLACRPRHPFANALTLEDPQRRPRAQKLPGQVDTDDGVPLLQRHVDCRGVLLNARIGQQNVQVPERLQRLLEQTLHVRLFRHIPAQSNRSAPGRLDLGRQRLRGFRLRVVMHYHRRTGRRQRPGTGRANPGTAASDQRHLSRERNLHECQHLFVSGLGVLTGRSRPEFNALSAPRTHRATRYTR